MGRLSELGAESSHSRTIEMTTAEVDATHILAAGRFRDLRSRAGISSIGRAIPAGVLHDLSVRLLVEIPSIPIEEVEVSIDAAPLEDCRAMGRSLDALVGLRISRGFTAAVRERVGRVSGCAHLAHLVCTLAPSALQGCWAIMDERAARGEGPEASARARPFTEYMRDSCYAWREDGEAYRSLLAAAGKI